MRTKSRVLSFIQGMRAAWHFGGAARAASPEAALRMYGRALALLSHPRVDPNSMPAQTPLVLSLSGYCRAAVTVPGPELQ